MNSEALVQCRQAPQTRNSIPGAIGALVLVNVFIIAMVVHEFQTRGRLHPVTLWAGAVMVLSEPLRVAIGFSAPWRAFARMLMG